METVAAFCAAALRALALSLRIRSASSSEIPLSAASRAIASLRARAFASLRAAFSAFAFSSAARAAFSAFAFSSAARAALSAFAFSSAARAAASAFAFSSAARAAASAFAFSSAARASASAFAFLAAIFFARCLSRFHCFLQLWQIAYSLKIGSPFSLVPICLFCKSRSFPHIGHFILIMYSSLLYQNIYNRFIIAS